MMRVFWRGRRGSPTKCYTCHRVINPGDRYVSWQTWHEARAHCERCGVPPAGLVSISRLQPIYKWLERLVQPEGYYYQAYVELHLALVKAREHYTKPQNRHPQKVQRIKVLTAVLKLIDHTKDRQELRNKAIHLFQTIDPLVVVTEARAPRFQDIHRTILNPSLATRVRQLRASGYGPRTIAKKLKLTEQEVRAVTT